MSLDIRLHQRLNNFNLALSELTDAITLQKSRSLSKLEEQDLIQVFEYNDELAWPFINA